ncbi:MAG: T9SS type A sorting domain-containing protein [Bacteroidia bacterium]|nr:T9SS type A sorting domain-containing protein [Bacteroidia bacterium]
MTKLYKKILSVLLTLSIATGMSAQTTVPSIISSNQVWTAAGSPYYVGQNTLIKPGATVSIQPGAIVKGVKNIAIIVQGTLIADGTFDSVIVMDSINFDFSQVSGGYNFNTSSGSYFNYCWFKGFGLSGTNLIKLNSVSMMISNCRFTNVYYSIYGANGSYDTTKVRIVRSFFDGSGYGYPASIYGTCALLEMDECLVKNMCGLIAPANITLTRCTFIGQACNSAIRLMNGNRSYAGNAYIRCNTFKNFKGGVFESFYLDSFNTIDLTNNTFDSSEFFLGLYAGNINNTAKLVMNKNNFLFSRQYDVKFSANSSPGIYKIYDLQDNYWGSTDTNDIKNEIYDYDDNITIMALVDYSNFRTSYNYLCSEEFTSVSNQSIQALKIYPNPANTLFNLEFSSETDRIIRLYDMMGRVVLEVNDMNTLIELNVSELNNGTYAIMVSSEGKTSMVGKVIVAH